MTQIYAVDSIMGTGKTNWAIKYMNCHKEQRFIYCTPFIDEVNRILSASPHFRQPTEENAGGTKQADFLKLLEEGACIATTHELFKRVPVTERILTLIQEWLGHSDFSTTANIYSHLDYASKVSSAEAMLNGLGMGSNPGNDT